MILTGLFLSQLTDVFRIRLVIALIASTARTAHVFGRVMPLAAGVSLGAVLNAPKTSAPEGTGMPAVIGCSLVSNAVILEVLLSAKALFQRFGGRL